MAEEKLTYLPVTLRVLGYRASSILVEHPKTKEKIHIGRSLLTWKSDQLVNESFFDHAAEGKPMELEIVDWWVRKHNLEY